MITFTRNPAKQQPPPSAEDLQSHVEAAIAPLVDGSKTHVEFQLFTGVDTSRVWNAEYARVRDEVTTALKDAGYFVYERRTAGYLDVYTSPRAG